MGGLVTKARNGPEGIVAVVRCGSTGVVASAWVGPARRGWSQGLDAGGACRDGWCGPGMGCRDGLAQAGSDQVGRSRWVVPVWRVARVWLGTTWRGPSLWGGARRAAGPPLPATRVSGAPPRRTFRSPGCGQLRVRSPGRTSESRRGLSHRRGASRGCRSSGSTPRRRG